MNSNLDIIGIAETDLRDGQEISIPGYKWFGHNRRTVHKLAKTGSGGVGFLIRESLSEIFDIHMVDKSYEGILWLKLQEKRGDYQMHVCVCYLPPDNSTRNVDVYDFFNTLTSQIYTFQEMSSVFICGDFNSRTSNLDDYNAGVDSVPVRDVIDYKSNKYMVIYFVNFCHL